MTGTDNTNPGNFANRPKEEVREIAAKGGHASGGGNTSSSTSAGRDSAHVSCQTSIDSAVDHC